MALTAAICTQCGAQIQVDESKDAGICPSCGTAFITEKVIHQFVTQNNFAGATINVQGGVDIENLYTLARRAVDSSNTDDVLKYYGQIRERNPNDWEATFFYAWFVNSENFDADFKITQDLILQLEPEKQVEALHKIFDFFKKINFSLDYDYGKSSPFPLKNKQLYYDFVMKFFDEKNPDIIYIAGFLTNYMEYWGNKGSQRFYHEILSREDNVYVPFLKPFHRLLHVGPAASENEKEISLNIMSTEGSISTLNKLLDSEEDKKNNFLDYYEFMMECAENLKPKNIKYLESKIKELDPTYTFSEKTAPIVKEKYSYNRKKIISIITSIIFAVLSFFGGKYLYRIDSEDEIVKTILIALCIANVLSLIFSFKYSYRNKATLKTWRVIIKTLIILALAFILFCVIFEHFCLKQ